MRATLAGCGALILAVPSVAQATPVYLACDLVSNEGAVTKLDVTADEASGQVTTLVQSSGFSERRTAVFSPTAVKWVSPVQYGGISYELSRTDLTITRTVTIGDKVWPDGGKCVVQTAPKRAF